MTSEDTKQQERLLADEQCVDALLAESGLVDDAGLRGMLLQLRRLRGMEVPVPSAELAALMGQPAETGVSRLADRSRKQRKNQRVAFTTLAVAASLGIAGGAAAGNDSLRRQAEGTISNIVEAFSPSGAAPPAADLPPEAPGRPPAVAYDSAGAPQEVTVPAPAPDVAPAPGSATPADSRLEEPESAKNVRKETADAAAKASLAGPEAQENQAKALPDRSPDPTAARPYPAGSNTAPGPFVAQQPDSHPPAAKAETNGGGGTEGAPETGRDRDRARR
jgi:hypothetical protein